MTPSLRLLVLAAAATVCSSGEPTAPLEEPSLEPRWASLGKDCPADAPATVSEVAAPRQGGVATVDDAWAAIARRVPGGWGGFFYENGWPTIYLVDPARRKEAISALKAEGIPVTPSTAVKQGRWDFAQLYDWYRWVLPAVWAVEGVSFTDIQEGRNRLEFGAVDEETRTRLEAALAELDLPCVLVWIEIRGSVVAA